MRTMERETINYVIKDAHNCLKYWRNSKQSMSLCTSQNLSKMDVYNSHLKSQTAERDICEQLKLCVHNMQCWVNTWALGCSSRASTSLEKKFVE